MKLCRFITESGIVSYVNIDGCKVFASILIPSSNLVEGLVKYELASTI